MSSLRFFQQENFDLQKTTFLDPANAHKALKVLRLTVGSNLVMFNNTNKEYVAEIIKIIPKKPQDLVEIAILTAATCDLEAKLKIHLVIAIIKPEPMDWIIQKAVELGASKITPLISARTIVKSQDLAKKLLHWQAIIIAACCQCGRNLLPSLEPAVKFFEFCNNVAFDPATTLIFTPDHNPQLDPAASALILQPKNTINTLKLDLQREISVIIGPEGGFTEQELAYATTKGAVQVMLGPRTLRTETAALASICALQTLYGDGDYYAANQ